MNADKLRITSLVQLFDLLPENERIMVDVLRQLAIDHLPTGTKEKFAFNVPFFYRNKGLCIVWPATIPRGGIKKGVLLGFWHGNKLNDVASYLVHGTSKKVFYKIYKDVDEIDEEALIPLFKEAGRVDDLPVTKKVPIKNKFYRCG